MTDKLLIDRHLLVIVTIYNSSPLILTRSLHVASEAQTRLHEVDERDEMWQTYSPNSHWCIRSGWTYRPFRPSPKSISIEECYSILFYHLKKLLYQLYHTILQYTLHPKTLLFYFFIKILFFNLSLLFLSNHQYRKSVV